MSTQQEAVDLLSSTLLPDSKRPVGRPRGPTTDPLTKQRRPAKLNWTPKQWRPEYERIVALSIGGVDNERIGQISGYSKEHISLILRQPQAEAIRQQYIIKFRERASQDLPAIFQKIAEKSARRLLDMVEDDQSFEKNPFAIIDRGLKIAEGIGHLASKNNNNNPNNVTNNNLILSDDAAQLLARGLKAADKAKMLHPGTDVSKVEEVKVEITNGEDK